MNEEYTPAKLILPVKALNQAFNRHSQGFCNPFTFVHGAVAHTIQNCCDRINSRTSFADSFDWQFKESKLDGFAFHGLGGVHHVIFQGFTVENWWN